MLSVHPLLILMHPLLIPVHPLLVPLHRAIHRLVEQGIIGGIPIPKCCSTELKEKSQIRLSLPVCEVEIFHICLHTISFFLSSSSIISVSMLSTTVIEDRKGIDMNDQRHVLKIVRKARKNNTENAGCMLSTFVA